MITTAIVGDLFIVIDPNGELETTVGSQTTLDFTQIFSLLKSASGDYYDVMSCMLDTGSGVLNLGAAAGTIFNDVSGIGRWIFSEQATWGTTRLSVYNFFAQFDLVTFLQEFAHRWGAYANYATTPNTPAQTLLHQDWIWTPSSEGQHWGRWLDDQNSSMDYDQAEWIDNGNGTYNRIDRDVTVPAQAAWFGYSALDQYLMGLVAASDVPAMKVLQNPSPALSELGPYNVPTGPYTPSAITTVTIAQIQNPKSDDPSTSFSGPRNPDYLNSQRVLHNAFVVVTKNSQLASTFITNSETWRRDHATNVRKVTSGRMMLDTSLLRPSYTQIYVKDNDTDTGAGTSSGTWWASPDLVVRNSDDNVVADEPTIRGQDNWIYVRVRNKSAQPYDNVTVNVYLANFAGTEFLYPVDWAPSALIGTATIASLPAASGGADGTAIAKIVWPAAMIPPALGWHPCLLAEVIPMEITPTKLHHVWENRKLAQRNVTIVDMKKMMKRSAMLGYELVIGHPLRAAEGTTLRLEALRQSEGTRLFLDPAGLVEDLAKDATVLEWAIPLDPSRIPDLVPIDVVDGPRVIGERHHGYGGLTLAIDRGTEIGILPDVGASEALRIRFEDDVRIKVGGSARGTLERRYAMRGLRPVVLNGLPLLEITDPYASVRLPLPAHTRRTLRIFGVVTQHPASYDITEQIGDRVVGGVRIELRA